jgi:hypothetical protein
MTLGKRRFKEMVEAATVDCYNDSELTTGWFTMIESYLVLPFKTAVLGATVTVDKVDLAVNEHIVAGCRRGGERQLVPTTFRCPVHPHPARSGSKPTAGG